MDRQDTRQAEQRQIDRRTARDAAYTGPERRAADRREGERRAG